MNQMPYNKNPQVKEVFVENIPGLQGAKFHKVQQPGFMDHALEPRAVKVERLTIEEMEKLFKRQGVTIYVHSCFQTWHDEQEGKYTLRHVVIDRNDLLAPLLLDFDIEDVQLSQNTWIPSLPARLTFNTEAIQNLEAMWGRDEVVRQLGEYLIQGLEKRHYDGKPDLNERADPVDSH